MSKFKKRGIDAVVAKTGVDFEVYDTAGESFGTFTLTYRDVHSPAFRLKMASMFKRLTAAERNRFDNVKTEADLVWRDRILIRAFVENYMIGWKVIGADDKPVPFTVEDAIDYLVEYPEIYEALLEYASEASNFAVVKKEEIAKN